MGYGTAEITKPWVCLYVEYQLGLSSLRAEAFKKASFSHPTAGSSKPFADMGSTGTGFQPEIPSGL